MQKNRKVLGFAKDTVRFDMLNWLTLGRQLGRWQLVWNALTSFTISV